MASHPIPMWGQPNTWPAVVKSALLGIDTAKITLDIGGKELVATLPIDQARGLALKDGEKVLAVIQSPCVQVRRA